MTKQAKVLLELADTPLSTVAAAKKAAAAGNTLKIKKTSPKKTEKKTSIKKVDKTPTAKKKAEPKPKAIKKPRVRNYLNNRDLLEQVIISKNQGYMSQELAKMLMVLCERYSKKVNWSGYSYIDDMQAFALASLCKTWAGFKPERSNNPFAYYTQCVKNSFNLFLKQEKRHRDIRDELLVNAGLNPSYSYQTEKGIKGDDGVSVREAQNISDVNVDYSGSSDYGDY